MVGFTIANLLVFYPKEQDSKWMEKDSMDKLPKRKLLS